MSHLRAVGEVTDPHGLASTALAEAVGYPGSSVAFAQLLSAMERSGLIEREIHGRRTYRIGLAGAAARGEAARAAERGPDPDPGPVAAPAAGPEPARAARLDYDELARWLLAEVVRRVTAVPGPGPGPGPGPARVGVARPPDPAEPADLAQPGDLPQVVASLEAKLASLESRQRRLEAENTRLAEQLTAARQGLADQQRIAASQESAGYAAGLDAGAAQMLERLMSSLRSGAARGGGKKTQAG